MKIVVTGVSSFVGYHLALRLLSDNHQVIGLSRNQNKNVQDLLKRPSFIYYKNDVSEPGKIADLSKGVDIIYHLAALSSERLCSQNPLQSVKINVLATINMLDVAKKNKSLFIFSSSGAVYPDSDKAKEEREASFTGKFYGTSKLLAEEYCRLYQEKYSVETAILRFSRIYGPGMRRNPIYDICRGLAENQPIKLYESLMSEYDFIYVGDVVKALVMAQSDNWKNKTVNISSNEAVRLEKIYEILMQISGSELPVEVVVNKKSKDILDNEMAKKLGFKTNYTLEEGLRETYLYFKKR